MSPSEEMVSVHGVNSVVEVVVVVVVVATQAGASLSLVSPPIGILATVHSTTNVKAKNFGAGDSFYRIKC